MDVTAVVKTFRRDAYLRECLASLKRQYPDISLIVVDDCGDEHNRELVEGHGGTFLSMPFDSGLPAGRNLALKHVTTPYVLIGDDDFYYENQDVVKLVELMGDADIAGGRVKENGLVSDYQGTFEEHDGVLHWVPIERRQTYCHFVFNFFVAKTEVLRNIGGWDENIKVAYEHSDFFINAWKKGVHVTFCPDALVTHKPEHVILTELEKANYAQFRLRSNDRDYFLAKWGYKAYIDIHGHEDKPEFNMFQLKAKHAFCKVNTALSILCPIYWAEAGTCLGIVREGNFIGHDSDLDFGVFGWECRDALDLALKGMGFTFDRERGTFDNGLERSYWSKDGVKVDIFFFYETGDTWWHSAWRDSLDGTEQEQLFFDFPKRLFENLKYVKFMDQVVPLPNPPEEYLALRYGDWQTPRKEWDWANDPLCRRK